MNASTRLARLLLRRRDSLGAAYHLLTFEAGEPVDARAGQFAMVRSPAWGIDPLLPRPMSLLTAGARPSILVKVVGKGTQRMALASPGDPFDLLAPLGRPFELCPPGHRALLVAGGVGVAPLIFLARELAAARVPSLALYGGRTSADLPLADELASAAALRVATEDGSSGLRGRVTVLLEQALGEPWAGPLKAYCCGPSAMMAKVASMCEARGVPCEASLETPMGCGYGVCLGCAVPRRDGHGHLYACTDGPCVDAASVDWSGGAR